MVASARQRAAVLGEHPAVPRISDLGHLYSSSLGKLELDMMSSHQMSERQVLDAIVAEAVGRSSTNTSTATAWTRLPRSSPAA